MINKTNAKKVNRVEKYITKISYKGLRNKKILMFNQEYEKYISMPQDAFTMEFIETNAMYEHKKIMLSLIFITFIATIVMNIWEFVYDILIQLLVMVNEDNQAFIQVVQILSCFIIILTFLVAALLVFCLCRNLFKLSKKSMFLKELKEMREHGNG